MSCQYSLPASLASNAVLPENSAHIPPANRCFYPSEHTQTTIGMARAQGQAHRSRPHQQAISPGATGLCRVFCVCMRARLLVKTPVFEVCVEMPRISHSRAPLGNTGRPFAARHNSRDLQHVCQAPLNDDENGLKHNAAGLLSTVKNGGEFEFTLTPAPNAELDKTNIVFGRIIEGWK